MWLDPKLPTSRLSIHLHPSINSALLFAGENLPEVARCRWPEPKAEVQRQPTAAHFHSSLGQSSAFDDGLRVAPNHLKRILLLGAHIFQCCTWLRLPVWLGI